MEVLADVEDLEVDKVFEVVGEGAEAVEAGVEGAEVGEVGDGVREVYELVGVH